MIMERLQTGRNLRVSDVTGSRRLAFQANEDDASIGEMLDGITNQMNSPTIDSGGRPITWSLRLNRTGQRLHPSDTVSGLQDGDELTLQPNVDAG